MRESLMYGSVRGARGNSRPYRDSGRRFPKAALLTRTFTPNEARSEGRAPAQLVGVFDRIAHRWYNDAR